MELAAAEPDILAKFLGHLLPFGAINSPGTFKLCSIKGTYEYS